MNNTLDLVRCVTILIRYAAKDSSKPDIRNVRSTHKPSKRHEGSGLLAYVRLGGTRIINPNVYCGMLRHTIIIDLYSPKTGEENVEDVFELKNVITKEFPRWGKYISVDMIELKKAVEPGECNKKDYGVDEWLDHLKCQVREKKGPAANLYPFLDNVEKSGPYELASSFLENSGLYSMENFSGAGIELSFEVDEKVGASC